MNKRLTVVLATVLLGLGTMACEKIEQRTRPDTTLTYEQVEFADAIPLDYGELVAITPSGSNPNMALMWFEQPDKTVVVVYVNVSRGGSSAGGSSEGGPSERARPSPPPPSGSRSR